MQEIITAKQVDVLFLVLAIAAPVAGAAIGWVRNKRALTGLLWGLLLTANWILWRLYNAITDHLGLDTVRNLLVNLTLFVVLGAVVGYLTALRTKRRKASYGAGAPGGQTSQH
ncbi:MAG: hypothetical protein KatS3mg022_0218 [Armatimonadota bacterium]|nr:MAG: hypothetical protein KatS3mg022_0218 [Armatimonadota bacterium]